MDAQAPQSNTQHLSPRLRHDDEALYWRMMYEALVANTSPASVQGAEAVVESACALADSQGVTVGHAFTMLMQTLFRTGGAHKRRKGK